MIIDNGRKRQLDVTGIFSGTCGESDGMLSFIPQRLPVPRVVGGKLDGRLVVLTVVENPTPESRFCVARYMSPN